MRSNKNESRIYAKIDKNEQYMKDYVGLGTSFDFGFRELVILKTKIQLYYVTGLCDASVVQQLMRQLVQINDYESNMKKVPEIIENRIIYQQVERTESLDEAVDQMLSGLIVIFVDGIRYAFIVDVRNYPGRTPQEPDTEHVVRGSRDGYTENIIENTALTRRRIRDARLRHEMLKVGERSKTDVTLCYIEDITNKDLIETVKTKLNQIEIDGITMTDKTLEEYMNGPKWRPYPLVRYTERPDVAATHLMEGHVVLIVDTSPSVIILPTTFFHHVQHAEEYRQTPLIGTLMRWTRFIGIMISIFLLPLWLLFALEPNLLPGELSFIGPKEEGTIPIAVQIILADLGIEFLRMAAIHTPTPLATSMGLIAAVLIGQIAIDVGLFGPEAILYVAVSAIGVYVTPSYELGVANKIARLILILATAFFGLTGFSVSFTLYILYLAKLRSLHTPYMWPFIPFEAKGMTEIIFRVPIPYSNRRPSVVRPKNDFRQPK
ncbi:spore germination protein [Lentibacillus amyloliquefaciens]|uniref:Stage V sporulation protein AF n=1 Tax=Lentibacillus amyloliquefaciens TaxID=1472767 RepID=A0A0U3W4B2_9BACI|nr:spore germination protein [Lentibacillus amyloliquefaciens]ALX48000.1 stage V sporulation protein AF [Lentibacillus amyloliquefaciens]